MRSLLTSLVLMGCAFDGHALDLDIDADAERRCEVGPTSARCDFATVTFATGAFGWSAREVHLMHPTGQPPPEGWPAVVLFQGSLHSAEGMFEAQPSDAFGGFHQTRLIAALLDAGMVVIAPEARLDGATYWDTNVVPYNVAWDASEDHQLMMELLGAIDDGALGPINAAALFATGISSGGYMTSRMAVSYPGRFLALAIQSASYATCAGPLCDVPELPADHPPTLFLHGAADELVPAETMRGYADALEAAGTATRVVVDESADHAWIEAAPEEIVRWFGARRP